MRSARPDSISRAAIGALVLGALLLAGRGGSWASALAAVRDEHSGPRPMRASSAPSITRSGPGARSVAGAILAPGQARPTGLPIDRIRLPKGFSIGLYATGIEGARSLAQGPKGVIFVGSRDAGNVYALLDRDGDQAAERVVKIASGLNMPNGVAFRDGSLYVAEVSRVIRFDGIVRWLERTAGAAGRTGVSGGSSGGDGGDGGDGAGSDPPKPVVVNATFPTDRHHGWKFIRFGPDGLLYVPVGAPCNVCDEEDPRYASIMRMKADGTALEVFARGIRNSVGFDWHPRTKELWLTDNGRDMMGDDLPPDELDRAPRKGLHFGFPYCHGGDIPDPKFKEGHPCEAFAAPAIKLGPHVAALGMRFYTGSMFPAAYANRIFIAEHGSWNRSRKIGYRVMMVRLEGDRAVSYEPFAEGWLSGESVWGRPVDVEVMPDGALLVSDDHGDAVYRIRYDAERPSKGHPETAPDPTPSKHP